MLENSVCYGYFQLISPKNKQNIFGVPSVLPTYLLPISLPPYFSLFYPELYAMPINATYYFSIPPLLRGGEDHYSASGM